MTGFVVGCDSDDGPTVTPPAPAPSGNGENGNGENGGPTRSEESETEGRRCWGSPTDTERRNNCSGVTINVGVACSSDGEFSRHFSVGPGETYRNSGVCSGSEISAPCAAPGVARREETGRYACYINTGITPTPYTGTPPTPGTPSTPVPVTTPLVTPTPTSASTYGSIAYGHLSRGYVWSIDYGRTASEARSKARNYCSNAGSTDCRSLEFTRGQCAALAHGTSTRPGIGVASGPTRQEAQIAAIAQCRSANGENCRIGTGRSGNPASACLPSS